MKFQRGRAQPQPPTSKWLLLGPTYTENFYHGLVRFRGSSTRVSNWDGPPVISPKKHHEIYGIPMDHVVVSSWNFPSRNCTDIHAERKPCTYTYCIHVIHIQSYTIIHNHIQSYIQSYTIIIYIYIQSYTIIYNHIYIYNQIQSYTIIIYIYNHIQSYTIIYIYNQIQSYTIIYNHIQLYIYIHMCICTYIYYTHTDIHSYRIRNLCIDMDSLTKGPCVSKWSKWIQTHDAEKKRVATDTATGWLKRYRVRWLEIMWMMLYFCIYIIYICIWYVYIYIYEPGPRTPTPPPQWYPPHS